jgi:hypothetical protein
VGDAKEAHSVKLFAFCLMRINATRFEVSSRKNSKPVHAVAAKWCIDTKIRDEHAGAREMKKIGPL